MKRRQSLWMAVRRLRLRRKLNSNHEGNSTNHADFSHRQKMQTLNRKR